MIGFANSSGRRTFYDIERKEQILEFLDTKIMGTKQDLMKNGLLRGTTILLE